jgi:hypothetical protein
VQIQGCFGACGPCLIGYLWRKEAHSLTSHSKTSTHTIFTSLYSLSFMALAWKEDFFFSGASSSFFSWTSSSSSSLSLSKRW